MRMEEDSSPPPVYVGQEEEYLPDPPADSPPPAPSQPTSRELQRFVARHNRQALLLAFFSLVGAGVLWGILYLGTYWFTLVTVTLKWSFNPETLPEITRRNIVGPDFLPRFLLGAFGALCLGAFFRKHVRLERLREQRHYFVWVLAELFMTVPNITFSIWGNLRAVCRLRRDEAEQAWNLLQRIEDLGGRMSMASLPLEIQDEKSLSRILFVLQIVGLVGVREKTEGWFLYLQDRHALVLRTASM